MPTHKLIALTNAVEGQDDVYNKWYDEVHMPDVCKVPGVISCQRFRLDSDKWKYMAIYELDCDNPEEVSAELMARAGTDAMRISESLDIRSGHTTIATSY